MPSLYFAPVFVLEMQQLLPYRLHNVMRTKSIDIMTENYGLGAQLIQNPAPFLRSKKSVFNLYVFLLYIHINVIYTKEEEEKETTGESMRN